jgi:hypothetical protein
VDARPGLEQVARLSGGKRREIHQVERAIRRDEHAPRVAEIWTHRTPYGAAEALWKSAQEVVSAKLNEPETKQKVQAKAEEYFRLLYPSAL